MRILQINTRYYNGGSTGRIVYDLKRVMDQSGLDSYVAFGYGYNPSDSESSHIYRIENDRELFVSKVSTKLQGHHGFYNTRETKRLLAWIDTIKPDLIHLHNIHNHYVNIWLLLGYIAKKKIPCVLTMHDCWTFTGHCSYFDFIGCNRWKSGCYDCPQLREYPKTFALIDPSSWNYRHKKVLFEKLNITFVTPSIWLQKLQQKSFLKDKPCFVINNGVDLRKFHPTKSNVREQYKIGNRKMILSVADRLAIRKGRKYLLELPHYLNDDEVLVLVGLTPKQMSRLSGINHLIPIARTKTSDELVDLYSVADVFINPTLEDNFPTTNLEALACGTPVITFDTGGSVEAIDDNTGLVTPKGDINKLVNGLRSILAHGKDYYKRSCTDRAAQYYNKDKQYCKYIELYKTILSHNSR